MCGGQRFDFTHYALFEWQRFDDMHLVGFFNYHSTVKLKIIQQKIVLHKCVMQIFAFCNVTSGDMKLL